jgi:hypothetical protein
MNIVKLRTRCNTIGSVVYWSFVGLLSGWSVINSGRIWGINSAYLLLNDIILHIILLIAAPIAHESGHRGCGYE